MVVGDAKFSPFELRYFFNGWHTSVCWSFMWMSRLTESVHWQRHASGVRLRCSASADVLAHLGRAAEQAGKMSKTCDRR